MRAIAVSRHRTPAYDVRDGDKEWSLGVMHISEEEAIFLERAVRDVVNQYRVTKDQRARQTTLDATYGRSPEAARGISGGNAPMSYSAAGGVGAYSPIRDRWIDAPRELDKSPEQAPDAEKQGNRFSGLDL